MNKIVDHEQLVQLISAHFKEMIREPGVLFWGIVFPILMSLGLGIAFTQKSDIVRSVAIVVMKQDGAGTADRSTILDNFLNRQCSIVKEKDMQPYYRHTISDEQLGNTTFHFLTIDWDEAMIRLKRGNLGVILDEQDGRIRYHFDPMNPDAQLTYLKLSGILSGDAVELKQKNDMIEPLTISGTRYIDFLIPGLMAMGIMMSCLWGISYGIIEKANKKTATQDGGHPYEKIPFSDCQNNRTYDNDVHRIGASFPFCLAGVRHWDSGKHICVDCDISGRQYCFCRYFDICLLPHGEYRNRKWL